MNISWSAGLLRWWVGFYTYGLPVDLREARREEIEADLWDQLAEASLGGRPDRSTGAEIMTRLLLGAPADITWRLAARTQRDGASVGERIAAPNSRLLGLLAMVGGMAVLVGATLYAHAALADSSLRPWERDIDAFELSTMAIAGTIGMIAIAAATVGLASGLRHHSRNSAVVAASVAAAGAVVGVLGAWPAMFLAPAGFAYFIWDLGRVGVLPRWISVANAAAALALLMPIAAIVSDEPVGVAIALVIPYWVTWLAIGRSLVRGATRASGVTPLAA